MGKLAISRLTWIIVSGVAISGISLYIYLEGNEAAVAGVLAPFNIIIVAILARTGNEIVTVEEENAGMDTTSLEENPENKTISSTAKFLDLSYTNVYIRETNEFRMDIYSSENQITLSSNYAPRRAHLVKHRAQKDTQTINSSERPKH